MFTQEENVEAVSTSINYSFTAIPNNFIYLLDIYCYKLFATLVQKETYWKNNNQLSEEGYFSMRIEDIAKSLGCQTKEINSTIEALYCCGLISVISVGTTGKRITNKYRINWDKVVELSSIPMQKILDENITIKKCQRGTKLTYRQQPRTNCHTNIQQNNESTEVSTQVSTTPRTNCHTTKESKEININIYNNDHIPVDDIILDDINKKENTIDSPIYNNCRNDYNEDINKTVDISLQEEIELDELVNNIPTIKQIMNKQQDNITETTIPTIEEDNNKTNSDNTIVNPMSVVLNFPVIISGEKQEINLNVEVNDINSLTHSETRDIYTNLKYQIWLQFPETFIDGYWTKDCCNSYPSPYEFEHVLLPVAIRKCKFNDDIKENSAPAPTKNAQEYPTIADQSSNDKEYKETQENAIEAKTEGNTEDINKIVKNISKKFLNERQEGFCNTDMDALLSPLTDYMFGTNEKSVKEYGMNKLTKLMEAFNYHTDFFESKLEMIYDYANRHLYDNMSV